jgi:hypothetical protein
VSRNEAIGIFELRYRACARPSAGRGRAIAAVSYVFISYKREDELRVARIAHALEAEGLEVWWDRGLPGGESWHSGIEAKLKDAGCVVVVWSEGSASADGGYVREEARRGLSRNILVPVLIDSLANLPLGFGEIQAIDLTRWRGDRRDAYFQDLADTVRAKLSNGAMPSPQGPKRRIARRMLWGSVSGVGVATTALLAFNAFGVAARVCTLPGPQPGLSDGCGALHLGGRPTHAERTIWESRAPGSCAGLRDHIERFPNGVYRSTAADLLTARKVSVLESWLPAERSLALFEPQVSRAKNQAAAQTQALESAKLEAMRLCQGFAVGTLYRYVSSSALADKWSCSRDGSGTACSFDGRAQCELLERHKTEQERCG